MRGFRSAWKEAAWVFILSRLMMLFVTYIGIVLLPVSGQTIAPDCAKDINPCILAWYHWDAVAYINIAHRAYAFTPDVAFFPLWPLIEHYGSLLLGGYFPNSYYFAGLLITNICFYFALVLFYCLLYEDFDPAVARRALFYLAFSPYALFFFAGYTESLFMLLCIALFLLLRRGKALDWWLAGLLGFLAVLTRSSGIILVIPFLVVYMQRFWLTQKAEGNLQDQSWFYKLSALLPVLLIPLGVGTYMVYLYYAKGNPLIFINQETTFSWHRHLDFPWSGFGPAIGTIFSNPFFSGSAMQNMLDIIFTLIPLIALAFGWRYIPWHYRLFALGLALFTLSFPQTAETLASQPRYMLSIFPIFVIFAIWGKRPRLDLCFMAFALPLLAVNVILFTHHYWVA